MTQLATMEQEQRAVARHSTKGDALSMSIDDIWMLAEQVAGSRMFPGIDKPNQAFTLMMLCQADQIHPMMALRRYWIIEGRPSMKAMAIQAEFIRRGGRIEIVKTDAAEARAIFSHPTLQPKPIEQAVYMKDFEKTIALGRNNQIKDNWRNAPADQLWWRLVSKTCRKIDPGIETGIETADEIQDTIDAATALPVPASVAAQLSAPSPAPAQRADIRVAGQGPDDWDPRPYVAIAQGVAEALGMPTPHIHADLKNRAIQQGHHTGEAPKKVADVVAMLAKLYGSNGNMRDWVRRQFAEIEEKAKQKAEQAAQAPEEPPSETQSPRDAGRAEVNSLFPSKAPESTAEDPDMWEPGRQ